MDMIYLAKIFGPLLIALGFFQVFCRKVTPSIAKKFDGLRGARWLNSWVSMALGLAIINGGSDWSTGCRALMPIYGWCGFIKGVLLLYFPKPLYKNLFANKVNVIMIGAIRIVFGLVFICLGYF